MDVDGYPTKTFSLDENGGPAYPGLVYFSTQKKIASDPALMTAFLDATMKGYDDTIADPKAGLADLLAENPALEPKISTAQMTAYEPLFMANAPAYGVLHTEELQLLSDYLVEQKLITAPITPERFGTNQFLPDDGVTVTTGSPKLRRPESARCSPVPRRRVRRWTEST